MIKEELYFLKVLEAGTSKIKVGLWHMRETNQECLHVVKLKALLVPQRPL